MSMYPMPHAIIPGKKEPCKIQYSNESLVRHERFNERAVPKITAPDSQP